jgi:hypothetical protein
MLIAVFVMGEAACALTDPPGAPFADPAKMQSSIGLAL